MCYFKCFAGNTQAWCFPNFLKHLPNKMLKSDTDEILVLIIALYYICYCYIHVCYERHSWNCSSIPDFNLGAVLRVMGRVTLCDN